MAKTIRLLKHYGALGRGDTMTPELDAVADELVRRKVAEYVVVPAEQVEPVDLSRRQKKLQAHGREG